MNVSVAKPKETVENEDPYVTSDIQYTFGNVLEKFNRRHDPQKEISGKNVTL